MLREGDGIGTSATRASIISELKRREFLTVKGKQVISTTLGRSVIDALPEVVKSPVLTALNERMLKGIEQGTAALDAFIARQETFIRNQVAKANRGAVTIAGGKEVAPVSSLHKCMACGSGLSRRPSRQKGKFWWGCSKFPTCKQTYPDLKGRPDYSKGRSGPASE
jgi:DNA topoisomerase-3